MKLLLIFFLILPTTNYAQQHFETKGKSDTSLAFYKPTREFDRYDSCNSVKGIKFGSDLKTVESRLSLEHTSSNYGFGIADSDFLYYDLFKFQVGSVMFFKDKLMAFTFTHHYTGDFYDSLVARLKDIFGNPIPYFNTDENINFIDKMELYWKGKNIMIQIRTFDNHGTIYFFISNNKLKEQFATNR